MPDGIVAISGTIKADPELKILLMEDAPTDAELIVDSLANDGLMFRWKRVETRAGLALAVSDFDPDILLCDNNLPDIDGLSAIQFVRARHQHLPIVVVTGSLDDESAVELVKAGANDYVRKDRLIRLPIAVRLALENASQRRKQEKRDVAVVESELRYRRRFEKATHGILVANAETQIIYDVNQSLVDLLGYSRDEYLGRTLAEFDLQRMEKGEKLPINAMMETGDSYECNLPICTKDGRSIEVEFVAVVFRAGNDFVIQCNMKDISIRRHLEIALKSKNQELEAASLAKDRFLASMSHELRTPLNSIIGFTGVLLMRLPGGLTPEQEKQLRSVRDSAKHLLALINDLLNLAKIGSGKVELGQEAVNIKKVLEDVAASLLPSAIAKGLEFIIVLPPCDVVVATSSRALWQIVTNLTANAIKFTSKGRVSLELRFFTTDGHRQVEIAISDTGVGIHSADQDKIFRPFSRVGDAVTQREEGTGLGLHISERLASLIGAKIAMVSEYRKGSTFTVTLRDMGHL